jgi:hypothetical protein
MGNIDMRTSWETGMHFDDAFDILVAYCAEISPTFLKATPFYNPRSSGNQGHDLIVADVVSQHFGGDADKLDDRDFAPFYDAAWELCRIGVLRPGPFANRNRGTIGGAGGSDGFTITAFGHKWLADQEERAEGGPSRMGELFAKLGTTFGSGFSQRAAEAVRCYQNGNYLASCVMAGAAAESTLLAVAIEKTKDEAKVLHDYSAARGRKLVTDAILKGLPSWLSIRFQSPLRVMEYWRDNAAHGKATDISEVEAYSSLALLLRFTQICSDHWSELTA